METETTLDFRLRPAWEAGFDGQACPEPPAWMEWHQVADWTAAYDRGRSAAGRNEAAEVVCETPVRQEPKGESDFVCGWCQQVVSWSARFVDQFDGNTPYHKVCWEHRQAGVNIAQAMNRPTTLDDLARAGS